MKPRNRIYLAIIVLVSIAATSVVLMQGGGVTAETMRVTTNDLEVSVRGEGMTRVVDRYVMTAPVSGQLQRISLLPGDTVGVGSELFQISIPAETEQSRQLAEARLDAASAGVQQIESQLADAREAARKSETDLSRMSRLAEQDIISVAELEQAERRLASALHQLDVMEAALRAAQAEQRSALALAPRDEDGRNRAGINVSSPIGGRILRIPDRSARTVMAGEPIIEIADMQRLELVVDVLSEDAMQIRTGNAVHISGWGDGISASGHVRYVEPAAFTKYSALGVEEQRVNVVIDLDEFPASVGDGFRADADVVVWSAEDVLSVPVSALFREAEQWFVFVVESDVVHRKAVTLGERSSMAAQVVDGLSEGDELIRYPSSDIAEGVRVKR